MLRIKEIRKSRGLASKDLADKINVAVSTMSLYENGKREPSNAILASIADALNVSVDELLGRSLPFSNITPSPSISEAEAALLELFRQVPAEHQEMVLGMIRVAIGNQVPPKSQ